MVSVTDMIRAKTEWNFQRKERMYVRLCKRDWLNYSFEYRYAVYVDESLALKQRMRMISCVLLSIDAGIKARQNKTLLKHLSIFVIKIFMTFDMSGSIADIPMCILQGIVNIFLRVGTLLSADLHYQALVTIHAYEMRMRWMRVSKVYSNCTILL